MFFKKKNIHSWSKKYYEDSLIEVSDKVIDILLFELGMDLCEITPSSQFNVDIDVSDLEDTRIILSIEEAFFICFTDLEASEIETVNDLILAVSKKVYNR